MNRNPTFAGLLHRPEAGAFLGLIAVLVGLLMISGRLDIPVEGPAKAIFGDV